MEAPVVRWGTPDDHSDLMALITQMHGEGLFPVSLSQKKLSEMLDLLLGTQGVFVLETSAGEVVGSVGFQVVQPWFSEELVLQEAWFYVRPDHRTFKNFQTLINRIKSLSDEHRLPLLLHLETGVEPERKLKLFGRSLKMIGGLFLHS